MPNKIILAIITELLNFAGRHQSDHCNAQVVRKFELVGLIVILMSAFGSLVVW